MPPEIAKRIAAARTFLFVPGDRPDRFDKAMTSGADMVIVDLEDAVAPASKYGARTAIAAWLSPDHPVVLRINAAGTEWFEDDLALAAHPGVAAIMLPKSVAGAVLNQVASERATIALVESARGILDLAVIAATLGVVRLAFGAIDLALDLDTTSPDTSFDPFRLDMVVASRAAGLPAPIDGVTRNFRDPTLVEATVRKARALGLSGKLCIHPAQIEPTHIALSPTDAEIAYARRVIDIDTASNGAAASIDGVMIDRPVVERAQSILRRI